MRETETERDKEDEKEEAGTGKNKGKKCGTADVNMSVSSEISDLIKSVSEP